MARSRTTFGKMERERAKQEKARQKLERRAARESEREEEASAPVESVDPAVVLLQLQELQNALAAGEVDAQEFEARRDHLRQLLDV